MREAEEEGECILDSGRGGGKSGEMRKVVVWEDEWQEEERGLREFKISQKKEIKDEVCETIERGKKEGDIKIPLEGLGPEEWTVPVYP